MCVAEIIAGVCRRSLIGEVKYVKDLEGCACLSGFDDVRSWVDVIMKMYKGKRKYLYVVEKNGFSGLSKTGPSSFALHQTILLAGHLRICLCVFTFVYFWNTHIPLSLDSYISQIIAAIFVDVAIAPN